MAETLLPDGSPMRILPMWLQGWLGLCRKAVYSWLDDHAPTMGAAIAYYMVFSLAPMLVMVIGVAGLAFGKEAAEGALFGELADLIGPESAAAVQATIAYCEYVYRRYGRFPAYTAAFRTIIGFQVCRVDLGFYDCFYGSDALPNAVRDCTERALRKG